MEVAGKNVVVTGASYGIGYKIAEVFAGRGANVLVTARSADKLAALAERIGGQSLVADLADADALDGLVERCIDALGHIDIWVNNAGMETTDAFVRVERDRVRNVARVNFEAPLLLTHDIVRHMLRRGCGHVVQMSSVADSIPFPGLTAYAGTKAGLTHFTESLRVELAGTGIGLTVVSPGIVETAMWDRLEQNATYAAPAMDRFRQLQFLPIVDPQKVAEKTVEAVLKGKRYVRIPARYSMYHMLNNAPRRLVQGALLGVKMPSIEISGDNDEPAS